MFLFFTQDIRGEYAYFGEDETRHLTQVLRKRLGDNIHFTDGKGHFLEATLNEINKKNCVVRIIKQRDDFGRLPFRVHIGIAPTKNIDRLEWFIEKAVEIGVSDITPLICQHSERTTVKIERLQGVALSAMKQSLKTELPIVHEAIDFQRFIQKINDEEKKINPIFGQNQFIAHCQTDNLPPLSKSGERGKNALILIGAEGDFSTKEIEIAKNNHFTEISLGKSRLRTETAGIVAVHTWHLVHEIFL